MFGVLSRKKDTFGVLAAYLCSTVILMPSCDLGMLRLDHQRLEMVCMIEIGKFQLAVHIALIYVHPLFLREN